MRGKVAKPAEPGDRCAGAVQRQAHFRVGVCAVLALISVLAMRASLKQPVEVLWVLLAGGPTGSLASAAWYKLIKPPRNSKRHTSSSSASDELTGAWVGPGSTVTLHKQNAPTEGRRLSRIASAAFRQQVRALRHLLRS